MNTLALDILHLIIRGGLGSGNWGYAGRPGRRGGSAPKSGKGASMSLKTGKTAAKRQKEAQQKRLKRLEQQKNLEQQRETSRRNVPTTASKSVQNSTAVERKNIKLLSRGIRESIDYVTPGTRSKVKDEIIKDLVGRTGLDYNDINHVIDQWAQTSNDYSSNALHTQRMASELFDVPLSSWQKNKIESVEKGQGKSLEESAVDSIRSYKKGGYKSASEAKKAVLQSMYDITQKFKDAGITEVVLYRGASSFLDNAPDKGTTINYKSNTLESWSLDKNIADQFSSNSFVNGRIFKTKVPVERILCHSGTGFGCLSEWEYVVLGGNNKDTAYVVDPKEDEWLPL